MYEICDKCGADILIDFPHKKGDEVFVLCRGCKTQVEAMEDRLNVLEGFVEEVERLAKPIR